LFDPFSPYAVCSEILHLPTFPVLGWATFTGKRSTSLPCLLDSPGLELTSSGHAAIALALRHLKVGAGDRVLVPTYHCPTMIAPLAACGAEPVFYPLNPDGTPDLRDFDEGSECAAMLAAHYFGIPLSFADTRQFCLARKIPLIEDCAHTLFGPFHGNVIGTFGDVVVASLTKFLPTSDGGLIKVANDQVRWSLGARTLRDEFKAFANSLEMGARYDRLRGFNYALRLLFDGTDFLRGKSRSISSFPNDSSAATLSDSWHAEYTPQSKTWKRSTLWARWIVHRAHRQRIVECRRGNYELLAESLTNMPGARPLFPTPSLNCAPYVFPLWVDEPERVYPIARARGIPVLRWDNQWPTTPTLPGDAGLDWATHVLQLGCHQDLAHSDILRMAQTLRSIIAE
jgi:dTDP-4-amino-4,6-dideoxygalactose transaminase